METRELRGVADVRAMDRVNRLAWTVAYDDIFPARLLDRDPEPDAALRDRLARIRSWTGSAFVAVDDASAGDGADAPSDDASADGVVGYAIVRWGEDTKSFVDADDAGLKEIYVDPDHWNRGVGTALLARVERAAPASADGLTLSMLAGNDGGRRFYERRGFDEVGETTDEIAGTAYDCVLFRKPLSGEDG